MSARQERKVVTCLFCDLVGFTAQAESMDPEDVAALLSGYHEQVRAELERHGGTVEKFIGDAAMALFGAPVAHEDDPERAVRAALAVRDNLELTVRVGITTGEALITLGGEPMAAGDVVNTASRLQSAAPTNGILVDETTYRATRAAIEYEQADPLDAKGKAAPVPVWLAGQTRALVGVDLRPQTALVGRERERDMLVGALERARREASPQLVTIVGVPGIGKSRLVAELFSEIERDPDLIYWRHGRSLPYGEGVAFWAFAEMVKAQAGILHSDDGAAAETKLHEAVSAAVEPDDTVWVEARLQPLIGLGERAGDRDESFAAWRRFVEALADQRPTVLVFEDLHWADDDLLDFVDHLVDWVTGVPLLVVGTTRPELLDRRPGWGGGKRNALAISLSPLDDVETAQLISTLLQRPVLPADTQEELLRRTGGNPLYAEQFVRMLEERGHAGELPETVQGIIAARLDALPAGEKALLQDGSVIGKLFWTGALEAVSGIPARDADQLLHVLERKEFVQRERRSSVAGETEHSFAHLLLRDVAYGQIPRAERAGKHRRTAEWMESPGRAEDRAELLAHHYLAALELGAAARVDMSDIAHKAARACVDAGDRAAGLNAFAAAARFYTAAVDLVPDDDPLRPYLVLKREQSNVVLEALDADAAEQAIETLLEQGDVETAAEASATLSKNLHGRGDRSRADRHLDRAVALAENLGPTRAKAVVLEVRARRAMMLRDGTSVEIGREALAIAEQLGLDELRSDLLNTIGTERAAAGDLGGLRDLELSIEVALAANLPNQSQRAYNNLAESYRGAGNWNESSRIAEERLLAAERFAIPMSIRGAHGELAIECYYTGRWSEALEFVQERIAAAEAGSPHYLEGVCRVLRAKMRFAQGASVHHDSDRGLELGREIGDPQMLGSTLAWRASLFLADGEREQASRVADEALAVPATFYAVVDLPFVLHDLGRGSEAGPWLNEFALTTWRDAALAIAAGDFHGAAEILGAMGNVAEEAYARLRSGTESDVRRALELYRSVGATRYLSQGEALLATSRTA